MKNPLRSIFVVTIAALLAAVAGMPSTVARAAGPTTYEGLWSVIVYTLRGDCDRAYRYPVRIIDGRVVNAYRGDNFQVAGIVLRNGDIRVVVARGGQTASGRGRLFRDSGRGRWSTSTGECSGVWTAVRRPANY